MKPLYIFLFVFYFSTYSLSHGVHLLRSSFSSKKDHSRKSIYGAHLQRTLFSSKNEHRRKNIFFSKGNIFEDNKKLAEIANNYNELLVKLSKTKKLTSSNILNKISEAGAKLTEEFNKITALPSLTDAHKSEYQADFEKFMSEKEKDISLLFDAVQKKQISKEEVITEEIEHYESLVSEFEAKKLKFGETVDLAKAKLNSAVRAIGSSLPPTFCWMKKIYIPKRCPNTHSVRKGYLCFQDCTEEKNYPKRFKKGKKYQFKLWGGICYEDCMKEGMKNKGFYCSKTGEWHFKKAWIPDSLTNFNKEVLCENNDTKKGALCYNPTKCSSIQYNNCGFAGCAKSKADCKAEITNMAIKTISSLTTLGLFIASVGFSSTISPLAGKVKDTLKFLAQSLVSYFQGKILPQGAEWKAKVLKAAKPKYIDYLSTYNGPNKENAKSDIDNYLNNIYDNWTETTSQISTWNDIINAIKDQYGALKKNMKQVAKCKQNKDSCMHDVLLPIVVGIDPTGIASLISAFAYQKCPHSIDELNLNF